jgi:hypothetical protein
MELIPTLARIDSSMRKFLSDTVIKREKAHKLDEKSKIETSWAMGDSIPHSVPARFLLCFYSVPSPPIATFNVGSEHKIIKRKNGK